jgi:SAM-dependent methyltransferase
MCARTSTRSWLTSTCRRHGCEPGRDLSTFKALGYQVIGLENSGCEVLVQNFLELDLPRSHFDGVFANAVLFHIPGQELPRVLRQLHTTMKPAGVLFSSNPRGNGQEGWNEDRYGAFHDWQAWRDYMTAANSRNLTTTIGRQVCRTRCSPGWRAFGGRKCIECGLQRFAARALKDHTMEYTRLRQGGLRVCRICLGCMIHGVPELNAQQPEDESVPKLVCKTHG